MLFVVTGISDYLKRPTKDEWNDELAEGWAPGPDGSSLSTDTIFGCRIGCTSPNWTDGMRYAANLHDFRYRVGRRLNLGDEYRQAADVEHRQLLLLKVNGAFGRWNPVRYAARGRCHLRYAGLRVGGTGAFTKAARMVLTKKATLRLVARDGKWQDPEKLLAA